MNQVYILLAIYCIGIVLVSLLLLLIPLPVMGTLTMPFSCRTFGIRKVKRWNSRTDTLGNFFLWISVLFCVCYGVIPYAKWIYLVWLTLSWLACTSRAVRLTHVHSADKKLIVIFFLNLIMGMGLFAALGFFNNFQMWASGCQWLAALQDGSARNLVYYLNEPTLFCYLLQAVMLMLPLFIFWGQFKYMRLENTFKARNIGLYVVKMLIWTIVLGGVSLYGTPLLYQAYSKEAQVQMASSLENLPADDVTFWDMFKGANTTNTPEEDSQPADAGSSEQNKQPDNSDTDQGEPDTE